MTEGIVDCLNVTFQTQNQLTFCMTNGNECHCMIDLVLNRTKWSRSLHVHKENLCSTTLQNTICLGKWVYYQKITPFLTRENFESHK